jgi:hypothetical protein
MRSFPSLLWLKGGLKPYAVLLAAALLSACSSTPPSYQAAAESKHNHGYSNQVLEPGLYRVVYTAAPHADPGLTYAYTLYRAAEISREQGGTHFTVVEGLVDKALLERTLAKGLDIKASAYKGSSNFKASPSSASNSFRAPASPALGAWRSGPYANHYRGPVYRRPYFYSPYYYGPVFIHPAPAPLPPVSVSLLVRVLKEAPSDLSRSFEAADLLMRLEPLIQRKPSA